jgi:hypothetical protein
MGIFLKLQFIAISQMHTSWEKKKGIVSAAFSV